MRVGWRRCGLEQINSLVMMRSLLLSQPLHHPIVSPDYAMRGSLTYTPLPESFGLIKLGVYKISFPPRASPTADGPTTLV